MSTPRPKPAANGQVWRDKDERGDVSTLTVTESDGLPGSFAYGLRNPSGRKVRIRLDEKGQVRGYVLIQEAPQASTSP